MASRVKRGFAFHCHHDVLVEYVSDYDKRVHYIKSSKPKEEQELRLRLFKMIPRNRIPATLLAATVAYHEAGESLVMAWGMDCPLKAFERAKGAYRRAEQNFQKELSKQRKYLERLHTELCPNCPWDGETIFPERKEI